MSKDGKNVEKKEPQGTADSQASGNEKSGKRKIVKKIVKQTIQKMNKMISKMRWTLGRRI